MKKRELPKVQKEIIHYIQEPKFQQLLSAVEQEEPGKRLQTAKDKIEEEKNQEHCLEKTHRINVTVKERTQETALAGGISICVNLGVISVCYAF